jgi:hypothetical protein
MPSPLRSAELYNGSSRGPEMTTIQAISVLILVLGLDAFHSISSSEIRDEVLQRSELPVRGAAVIM